MASNRREFLTGRALQGELQQAGAALADELLQNATPEARWPSGPTVRLAQTAMACDFEVVLNPGPAQRLDAASSALHVIAQLEDQYSVYRLDSELSRINQSAAAAPVTVEPRLFELLLRCQELSRATAGAFDPTTGPLIALWRRCKADRRLPATEELNTALNLVGIGQISFDSDQNTVHFPKTLMELNLGSIGKGAALDRAAEVLIAAEVNDFLLQGGQSSILASGRHAAHSGWPVAIADPQFPQQQLATVLLENCALSTSGANLQYFRIDGVRYGHILDPRTGWPVSKMLSVTVLAPTAAEAEALSTAFFILGVETARQYCHNHPLIGACFVTADPAHQRSQLEVCGIAADRIALPSRPGA